MVQFHICASGLAVLGPKPLNLGCVPDRIVIPGLRALTLASPWAYYYVVPSETLTDALARQF